MATQAALRQRVFDRLYATPHQSRPAVQRINDVGGISNADETLIVDSGTEITVGDIIEFDDGEQAFVAAVSTNTLTIYRGWNGTTATAHADDGFIKINPRYTIKMVDDAMTEVLRDLQARGLYIMRSGTDITLVAGQNEYEIAETDFDPYHGVLSIYYRETSDSRTVGLPFRNVFDSGKGVHTTSGLGVVLISWGNNSAGDALEVIYAAKLDSLADTDNEPMLEDLIVTGTLARLIMGIEAPRFHDPGRFTDRTVQPGEARRVGLAYQGLYEREARLYRAHLRAREKDLPGSQYRRVRKFRR